MVPSKVGKGLWISILLEDKPAHRVMNVPCVFRELFLRCGEVSEIGVLPLRACLIELFQNWSDLGFSGEYALSFTQEQVDTYDRQFSEYQAGIIFRLSRARMPWHWCGRMGRIGIGCEWKEDAEWAIVGYLHWKRCWGEIRRRGESHMASFSGQDRSMIWTFIMLDWQMNRKILEAVITFFPSIGKPKDQLTEAMAKNDYRAQQSSTRIVLLVTSNALSAN